MANTSRDGDGKGRKSPLELFLSLFANVQPGEGITCILMFLNIFLVLSSYYVMKTVREALAIGGISLFGLRGAEIKAYLPAVMALLMLVIVPAYGNLASKVDRIKLVRTTTSILIVCLALFWLWGRATGVGTAIGLTFFIWIGIVNVFLVAQFWAFANDIYTEAAGKRLFAIIMTGQTLGAVLGPKLAAMGAEHMFLMLALSGVALLASLGLYTVVNGREGVAGRGAPTEPLKRDGGFELVFKTKYLLYIALMVLVANLVNTTGEYILGVGADEKSIEERPVAQVLGPEAAARVEASPDGEKVLSKAEQDKLKEARAPVVGSFYGNFFAAVNLIGLIIQLLLVSRIIKYLGMRFALFVLPVIAFGGYAAIGLIGGLLVVRAAKIAENSVDYSIQNTVKRALFLPTSREAKYKAMAVIEMFFVRFGDAASAGLVWFGLHVLAFGAGGLSFVNVALCVLWIALAVGIAREHRKLEASASQG